MNLYLPLKKEYFYQISSGEKTEEFRLVTPYWSRRLEGRHYERVIVMCGYPARDDTSRRINLPWRGYVRKTITHPHFGSDPVEVYAINVAPNNRVQSDGACICPEFTVHPNPLHKECGVCGRPPRR